MATMVAAGTVGMTPDQGPAGAGACVGPHCAPAPQASASGSQVPAASHHGRVTVGRVRRGGAATGAATAGAATAARQGAPARTVASSQPGPSPAPSARARAAATWVDSLPQHHLDAPIVAVSSVSNGHELVMVGSDGGVFPVGQAGFYGSLSGRGLAHPIAAVAADPATGGYWLAGRDGGVFAFHSPYHGGLGAARLASPVAGMAATATGQGYWLASADGGVFAFGDAPYRGSLSGKHLSSPIVAMAATPTGGGYWLVSADGGVFAFGDAPYRGSLSRVALAGRVASIQSSPTGHGYWMVSTDGGVYAFGDARFSGAPASRPSAPVSSMAATADGRGYWLVTTAGNVYAYGNARTVAAPPPPARPAPQVAAAQLTASVPTTAPPATAPVSAQLRAYPPAAAGFDISQYQCAVIPPNPAGIAVVQVTGGAIDNAPNPCFQAEATWAGANMAAYIYLDGLPTKAVPGESLFGPAGVCPPTNIACTSYNYGWFWARHWVDYARGAGVDAKMWWVDVEKYSGWQDPASNQMVIRGALDGLSSKKVQPGVYSTAPQWAEITANMAIPGLPIWVAGAGDVAGPGYTARAFCGAPTTFGFGGGRLELVQYGYQGPFPGSYSGSPTGYDQDFAC